MLIVLVVTPTLGEYEPLLSIRHGRSRSHLTRSNHPFGRMETSDKDRPEMDFTGPEEPEVESLLGGKLQMAVTGPPDPVYTEEGLFVGPLEDLRFHPKDDAEDLEPSVPPDPMGANVDIVTRFLRIVESQQQLGENCTAGTGLNLGEGVVDRYAQVSVYQVCSTLVLSAQINRRKLILNDLLLLSSSVHLYGATAYS